MRLATPFLTITLLVAATVALASETYTPPTTTTPARVTVLSIYKTKCSKCHEIARPDGASKDAPAWKATIDRMRGKQPDWISTDEAEKIVKLLVGRDTIAAKCNKCHPASRADIAKTKVQWISTIDRMQNKAPDWISNADKETILFYLTDAYLLELE